MRIDEIETRKAEIRRILSGDTSSLSDETIAELSEEVRGLNDEAAKIEERNAAEAALRSAVDHKVVEEIKSEKKEERKVMTDIEIRSSREYSAAFLKALKTGDETEARALLTTNVSGGQIPVPTYLENEIKTAWEEHQLLGLVKHTYLKGNVKLGFEISATGATVHIEGTAAPEEENIVLGVVEIKAANIKKWITVSDEAFEGTDVDTAGYLYKEIAHKIVEQAEEVLINKITASPATATATEPGVPAMTANSIAADTVVNATSMLAGAAKDLRLVMNRRTKPAFAAVALAANYAIDVYDGLQDRIIYSDRLPAFSAASAGSTYAIIGDFGEGAQANFPNGDNVNIKVDDMSLSEQDLVKLVGKEFAGIAVVADRHFVCIKK